jgi:hypothetical protein
MEALECRDELRATKLQGLQRVHLEIDCLEVATVREKRDSQCSTIRPVLEEIDDLRLAFQEFLFSYTSRVCNKVAQVLAKQVTSTHRDVTCNSDVCI